MKSLASLLARRTPSRLVLLVALTLAARAHADPVVGETSVELAVGSSTSLDVGFARGAMCDDVTIVRPELRAASPTSNVLVLSALRRGTTDCRAGTTGVGPSVVVHVKVK